MQTSMHKHSSKAIVRLACIGRSEEGVDRMVDSWAETSRYFGGKGLVDTMVHRYSWAETGG